jgi:hypothetical protein
MWLVKRSGEKKSAGGRRSQPKRAGYKNGVVGLYAGFVYKSGERQIALHVSAKGGQAGRARQQKNVAYRSVRLPFAANGARAYFFQQAILYGSAVGVMVVVAVAVRFLLAACVANADYGSGNTLMVVVGNSRVGQHCNVGKQQKRYRQCFSHGESKVLCLFVISSKLSVAKV